MDARAATRASSRFVELGDVVFVDSSVKKGFYSLDATRDGALLVGGGDGGRVSIFAAGEDESTFLASRRGPDAIGARALHLTRAPPVAPSALTRSDEDDGLRERSRAPATALRACADARSRRR